MTTQRGNKKQVVFLAILLLFAVLFITGYFVKDKSSGKKIISISDRAPDFHLQTPEGRIVSLSDFRGKVVMVHFWATWCPPCVDEIPTLDNLYRALMGSDFELLAISVDEGGAAAVAPFMRKNKLNLPVLFDPERAIAGSYGTYKFPETYIVDRQGVVRLKVIGPRDWADPANVQVLRNIIATQ